jgi:hypothetical protein
MKIENNECFKIVEFNKNYYSDDVSGIVLYIMISKIFFYMIQGYRQP